MDNGSTHMSVGFYARSCTLPPTRACAARDIFCVVSMLILRDRGPVTEARLRLLIIILCAALCYHGKRCCPFSNNCV